MTNRRYVLCCAIAAINLATSFGASAQQQSTSQPSTSASDSLAEVVVTAQRRSERLQDVPITITNITSQQLTDANIRDLSGIVQVTPALRFDNDGPFVQPTIRGVGSDIVSTDTSSDVGIYIDGYYSPNPSAFDFQLLNVDSVQVLKGPQGTLFGRNTPGGAILVNTLKPSEQTSAMFDASYGSFNAQRYEGYVTTGLFDHVAMDVAAIISRGDGFVTNIVDGDRNYGAYDNWSIRTGLKIDPSDNVSILVRYEHQYKDDPSLMLNNAYVRDGQPLTIAAIIPGDIYATDPSQVAYAAKNHQGFNTSNDIVQITPTIDLSFGTLTSYSQYRRESSTFIGTGPMGSVDLYSLWVPYLDSTITQEFLLTSKQGAPLQWTTGAFFLNYKEYMNADISLAGGPDGFVAGSAGDTVSDSVFGDATYQVAEKFYVTAGARFNHDEVNNAYYVNPDHSHTTVPNISGNRVTPRAVLRYTPDDNSSIYASYSLGYKAAIYDVGGPTINKVEPETLNAFEVGYKYAAQRLSFDAASYYYKFRNLQVSNFQFNPVTHVPYSEITNAADARIYGLDGDIRYAILHSFEITAGAAYTNAKYTRFPNAPSFTPCFSYPACGANYGMQISTITDASGFQMVRAPEFTATVGPRYSMGLAGGQLAFSGNLYYTSAFYFEASHQTMQGAYATLGLRAEWTDPTGRFTFAVYGDNVTDKRYLVRAESGNLETSNGWSAPATVYGEIRVRF
jgi:iron complex outermembrane recepter protein